MKSDPDSQADVFGPSDQGEPWQVLIDTLGEEVLRFLYRLVGATAQDLCQETFLRAIRKAPFGLPPAQARPLLYRIARNLAVDHSRKQRRRGMTGVESSGSPSSAPSALPDEQIDQAQLLDQVEAYIGTLPDQQRLALILRLYQELTYAEIAATLGGTEAAARANVYQALKKIRHRFATAWEEIR